MRRTRSFPVTVAFGNPYGTNEIGPEGASSVVWIRGRSSGRHGRGPNRASERHRHASWLRLDAKEGGFDAGSDERCGVAKFRCERRSDPGCGRFQGENPEWRRGRL